MQSLGRRVFHCEDVEVDVARRMVRRDGEAQFPRARTFDLLVYLIERRDRIVPREELLSALWPDTSVTPSSLSQCVNEARKLLGDDPREPRFIRTAAKSGYQFIGAVEESGGGALEEITSVEVEYIEESAAQIGLPAVPGRNRKIFAIAALVAVLAGCLVWALRTHSSQPGTILILPFENQTANAEFDWLREGLPDMLTTNLGRASGLQVVGREQVRSLLGAETGAFDRAMHWGRVNGETIVATGTFASLGPEIHIEMRFYRARDGKLLLSQGFTADRPEQILTHLDLAALQIASGLGHPVGEQDKLAGLSTLMTSSLEAYRYYVLGMEKANAMQPAEAIALFEKATALDPQFAMAHARIGYTYTSTWGLPIEGKASLERAFRLSERLTMTDRMHIAAWYGLANFDYPAAIQAYQQLIRYNPRDAEAYRRLGSLLGGENRTKEAVDALQAALVIDPSAASSWNMLSGIHTWAGNGEQGVAAARRYVALVPSEPNAWDTLGLALHVAGKLSESVAAYRRALELKPHFDVALIHMANVAYQRGRFIEARELCQQYLAGAASNMEKRRGYDLLALIHRREHRYAEASAAAQAAVDAAPGGLSVAALLALDRGDGEAARKLIEQQSPVNGRGRRSTGRDRLYFLARIAMTEGKTGEALDLFRQALAENPPVWAAEWREDALGDAYLELGRYAEATAEYERAMRRFPFIAMTRYHLAEAYSKLGRSRQACHEFAKFHELWTGADAGVPEMASAPQFCAGVR